MLPATMRMASIVLLVATACACSATAMSEPPAVDGPSSQRCLVPGSWHHLDHGRAVAVSAADTLRDAAAQDVVLLGEFHTSADDHRWQLQTLSALHLLHPRMVIGFEAFPRRLQPILDKWVAGQLDADEFLKQVDWKKTWGYSANFYMPMFEFARMNHIPMLALNVDKALPRDVGKQGWDAVPASMKEGLSRPAAPPQAYVDKLFKIYKEHAMAGPESADMTQSNPKFRHFVEAQATWDRAMAEALAQRQRSGPSEQRVLAVGIMGAGHVRDGTGIPHQLHDLGVNKVAKLLPVNARRGCKAFDTNYADAVFALPEHPISETRMGVQLDTMEGEVRIVAVEQGSVAEQAGLKADDAIAMAGGAFVKGMDNLLDTIRDAPPGSWLPVKIERGEQDQMHDLVLKFPSR